ncbi:ABC transporter ATP-binding protein [Sulfurimonas sp. MAG313]|nr:ABC transporter ATP-binding protein [Sulfurimonas sp. MAG313]MDF1882281.1 ABC transporter ATP-binding protein [Sulfurimonas sp. MAG313]
MQLLSAINLAHDFEYPLFTDINLSLNVHESMAIIGASGSGKSTLLHILSSLLEPKEGRVELFDENIYDLKKDALVHMRRNDIGMVFQSHYLFKGFSAYENLEVAAKLSNTKIEEEVLEGLGIKEIIHQKVTELSGGQQQRVSIARVLTKKPRLIFADEPTGNLDSETAFDVMKLFTHYIKENDAAMVLVTHEKSLAMQCDHVYKLVDMKLEKVK